MALRLSFRLFFAFSALNTVYSIACNSFNPLRYGPACPFDCTNCGGVTCDNNYVCVSGYCARVNGPAGPQGCAFEDIARGGRDMAQLSIYNGFGPFRAANRRYASDDLVGCTHTATGVSYPWWRVDFGSQHVVYAVQLYNRITNGNAALDRLSFFDIRVGNTDIKNSISAGQKYTGNQLCKNYNKRVPERLTSTVKPYAEILCDRPVRGRYMSLQMNEGPGISRGGGYSNVLTICEISIRGYRVCGSGGRHCDGNCLCRDGTECTIHGYCLSGCQVGRLGTYCLTEVLLTAPVFPDNNRIKGASVHVSWTMWNDGATSATDSRRGEVSLHHGLQYRFKRVDGTGEWKNHAGSGELDPNDPNRRVATISGLAGVSMYDIRVVLWKTFDGRREVVAHGDAKTKCANPTVPRQMNVTTGCQETTNAFIDVQWQPPADARCPNARTLMYVVHTKPDGELSIAHTVQGTQYRAKDLAMGTRYLVRVIAKNNVYRQLFSSADQYIVTSNIDPSVPLDVSVSSSFISAYPYPNMVNIKVNWKRPISVGCKSPVYIIEYGKLGEQPQSRTVSTLSETLSQLVPYTRYSVTVTVLSAGRRSTAEVEVLTSAEGMSSEVLQFRSTAQESESVSLAWTTPAQPYGVIAKYEIEYQRLNYLDDSCRGTLGSLQSTEASAGSTASNITRLEPHAEYKLVIAPYTAGGSIKSSKIASLQVRTKSAVPSFRPDAPTVNAISATTATVRFHVVPCSKRNGLFKEYLYHLTDISYGLSSMNGASTSDTKVLSTLTPYTKYAIVYQWSNNDGPTVMSEATEFQTNAARPIAPTLRPDAGSAYMNLLITPPFPPHDYLTTASVHCVSPQNGSYTLHGEEVIADNSKETVIVKFDAQQFGENATSYDCTATVASDSYTSLASEVVNVQLEDKQSDPPRDLRAGNATTDSINLTWRPPAVTNGIIIENKYSCRAVQTKNPGRAEELSPAEILEVTVHNTTGMDEISTTERNLWSATEYTCSVRAVNGWGESKGINTTFWTLAEDIEIPATVKPSFDGRKSDNTSVYLILPAIQSPNVIIERYRIRVELSDDSKNLRTLSRQTRDTNLTFDEAVADSSNEYIAAEWNDARGSFIVGDEEVYDEFYNSPLVPGETYDIAYGVGSNVNGSEQFSYTEPVSVTVGEYPEPPNIVPYILIGVGVVLVIIFAIVVFFLCRRYQPCDKRSSKDRMVMSEMGQDNVGADIEEEMDPTAGVQSTPIPVPVPKPKPYTRQYPAHSKGQFFQTLVEMKPADFAEEYEGLAKPSFHKSVAMNAGNAKKNRVGSALPFDHSRVQLAVRCPNDVNDYINASWIQGYAGKLNYIAAPGPIEATCADFWRMIWQNKVEIIVMLTDTWQNGQESCAQYWPQWKGEVSSFSDMNITNTEEERITKDIKKRVLVVLKGEESRTIQHFQYVGWPGRGVPALCGPLLKLRAVVRGATVQGAITLVHCGDGSGRTGVYLAVNEVLREQARMSEFNIKETVTRLRHFRDGMVQNDRGYVFVYQCVLQQIMVGATDAQTQHFTMMNNKFTENQAVVQQYQVLEILIDIYLMEPCIGRLEKNLSKNRDSDIVPADQHRPTLQKRDGKDVYVNACCVPNLSDSPQFIATQLPLGNSVIDLLQLIVDLNISVIVRMHDQIPDKAREQYWPSCGRLQMGQYTFEFRSTQRPDPHYTVETFSLIDTLATGSHPRTVYMLAFHDWPDTAETPNSPHGVLQVLDAVKRYRGMGEEPVLVQCDDGATRSGLLCASYCLLESLTQETTVSVFDAARLTQSVRPQFLPDMAQYAFLHAVLCEYVAMQDDDYVGFEEPPDDEYGDL